MAELWPAQAQSLWTAIPSMCLHVHNSFHGRPACKPVDCRFGWAITTSGYSSSEEYSHVISFKGPSWSRSSNAGGNSSIAVWIFYFGRSSGPAFTQVGALWRIFFPLSRSGHTWCSSAGIGSVDQPVGIEPARRRSERYLQLQSLVRINAGRQHPLGER